MNGVETAVKELNTTDTKLDVVAMMMNVQKAAVSKMQQKRVGDLSVAKLKAFAEAVGADFSAEIKLPNGEVIEL